MLTCTRRIHFSSGHRVWRHESKCAHLHGHNYVAFFQAHADDLDALGRVIDFGELKTRLGAWIDRHWDHGFLLHRDDHEAIEAVTKVPGQKVFLMDNNPTAENIARHLLCQVAPRELEGTGVRLVRVCVWETENCSAEHSLPEQRGVYQTLLPFPDTVSGGRDHA